MGWDYHHEIAPYDRRAICRRSISDRYEVVKDAVVGTTYYGAIRCKETGEVYAVVVLTHVDRNGYCNFGMKWMDEECGPLYYDCPETILRELSPTTNKYALEWREKCREKRNDPGKKVLSSAPIGSKLKVILKGGQERIVVKMAPAYQFKTTWLLTEDGGHYIPKTIIARAELVA